jgi:hypothetical protein
MFRYTISVASSGKIFLTNVLNNIQGVHKLASQKKLQILQLILCRLTQITLSENAF